MKAMRPEDCDLLTGKGIQERNIDNMIALFEHNASFVLETGEIVTGHEAIKQALIPFLNVEDFKWIHLTAFPNAENDLAFLRGLWTAKRVDADGNKVEIGNNIEVVRRQADGSWLFVIGHATGADSIFCHDFAIKILGGFKKIEKQYKIKKPANHKISRFYQFFSGF